LTELSNRSTGELRLKGGGSVDIWSFGFHIGTRMPGSGPTIWSTRWSMARFSGSSPTS